MCGNEFASLDAECEFIASRSLSLDGVEREVRLVPGELLIFDNLRLPHGRRRTLRPGELNQRVFGHAALSIERQLELKDALIAEFANRPPDLDG